MDELDTRQGDGRAKKVAAARKRLKTFRASRSSASSSSFSSTSPIPTPDPLTTDTTNIPLETRNSPKKSRGKGHPCVDEPGPSRKLRKPRSKPSLGDTNGRHVRGHSRQASSIAVNAGNFTGLSRGTVMDLFEGDRVDPPMRGDLPPFPTSKSSPGRIITTPVPPHLEEPSESELEAFSPPVEDHGAVKSRLNTFSFGSKAPPSALRRSASPQAPPTRRFGSPIGSPITSPTKRLSTPSAHGPSLLLTRPTPLAFSPAAPRIEPPGTPPTPARTKRHSHTRSNSISLPNLKLASRPPSLGIPVSPSFPASPSSPINFHRPATATPLQGTRLKFEPSGRGAEAEKEKDEYRRKALEKLTGSPLPEDLPSSGTEISLPDLDDEDTSSVASSVRPFSGVGGGFNFGRPMSSSSTPGLSWSSGNEDSPPPGERWSGFSFGLEKEDGLGFGLPLTTSFSAPTISSLANEGLTMPSRPSLQRNLSVLAEVEEPEEGDETMEQDVPLSASPELESPPHTTPKEKSPPLEAEVENVPIIAPTPSRLRQLHLLSSHSTSSNSTPSASSIPAPRQGSQVTPGSPTKGYGTIGRGRPRPLTLAINTSQAVSTASPGKSTARTPQSAGAKRRGGASGGRSRGSSISYVKPESTSSAISTTTSTSGAPSSVTSTTVSRDWSISSSADIVPPRNLFFSPPLGQPEWSPSFPGSPPLGSSPKFSGWGNIGRAGASRPCPRPKSIVGLGDGKGAGRVLGEVAEVEEDELNASRQASGSKPSEEPMQSPEYFHQAFDTPHDASREWQSPTGFPTNVGGSFSWRDPQLELEMERDALREDVDLWKARCGGLEERLELEKKEVVVLRERVRKLGDRLSAVQSSHPATMPRDRDRDNAGLLAEMRTQLFTLTAQVEQERKDKEAAVDLAESIRAQLSLRPTSTPAKPALLLRPTDRVPMAIVTPATPLDPTHSIPTPAYSDTRILQHAPSPPPTEPTSSPGPWSRSVPFGHEPLSPVPGPELTSPSPQDTNDTRMRAWGFPAAPSSPAKPRNRDRDSFFGLSNPLQRNSIDGRAGEQGMDLPPFDLAALTATSSSGADPRAVSDPLPITSPIFPGPSPPLPRSSSLTSSASSAISFFSGYLPSFSPPSKPTKQRKDSMFGSNSWLGRSAPEGLRARDGSMSMKLPLMGSYGKKGELDFRETCRCCVGEVMEL